MKVFRFMSNLEFEKLMNDEILVNDKVHEANTNSKGFCFLNCEDFIPEKAIHFLSGVVNLDKCVVFEVDEKKLNETWGEYAEPIETTGDTVQDFLNIIENFRKMFRTREYCTKKYSNKDFKIIKYCNPKWTLEDKEWEWIYCDRK